jgi:hypothetical protein
MKKISLILLTIILLTGCGQSLDQSNKRTPNKTPPSEPLMSTLEESRKIEKERRDELDKLAEKLAKEHVYYKEEDEGGKTVTTAFLKELPDSKPITVRAFNECGSDEDYRGYPWYNLLKTNLHEMARQPEYINLSFYRHNPDPPKLPIVDMCLSLDQKFAIGIYGVDYCDSGFVFRYNIDEDLIEVAKYLDDYRIGCKASLSEFGKREGNIIPVKSFFGDAGFISHGTWEYDFTKNTLKLKEICHGSHSFEDKNGDGTIDENDEQTYDETCENY